MENGISTINKEKIKVKKPKHYKVVMYNDDFTTMEFVVNILMTVFKKDINTSNKIMMDVHKIGRGIVGVYPYDIATTKVAIALGMAKEEGFPFNITIEEA
ncbi:ATP-dependent Clp protease adaptor ClpS [uncultured Clostridium sp.]|uniref:ATP-dependent Clp protease adaptor ClpS n=1 Tax=uncultured Clostridium sp. TaxID=59620 RepID=UPI0025D07AC9|nr:ATP-dependent Clp protease adaptor ClpS [uncultured Clostridium sp.]MDU4883935.1 ATP-dependent Clp protease adaptor ClpS [Clostridium celatum]MDU7077212.1 ATP-dependent Clp protease adaptor ClpS [Clostridium celatum]